MVLWFWLEWNSELLLRWFYTFDKHLSLRTEYFLLQINFLITLYTGTSQTLWRKNVQPVRLSSTNIRSEKLASDKTDNRTIEKNYEVPWEEWDERGLISHGEPRNKQHIWAETKIEDVLMRNEKRLLWAISCSEQTTSGERKWRNGNRDLTAKEPTGGWQWGGELNCGMQLWKSTTLISDRELETVFLQLISNGSDGEDDKDDTHLFF